jgi:L-iditol 2-dehydrogenase
MALQIPFTDSLSAVRIDTEASQVRMQVHPPLPNEVQIEIRSTTLCGSDVHYYTSYHNGGIHIKEPLSQGHESAGQVVMLGSEIARSGTLKVGDKVALEVGIPCDECEVCTRGRYNICEEMRFRSSAVSFPHFQGTLQSRINHPGKWCHK